MDEFLGVQRYETVDLGIRSYLLFPHQLTHSVLWALIATKGWFTH